MKTTNYYKVMYEVKKHQKDFPKTISELSAAILRSERKLKIKKIFNDEEEISQDLF